MPTGGLIRRLGLFVTLAACHPQPSPNMDPITQRLHDEVASGRTPAVQYRHFTRDAVLVRFDEGMADLARGVPVSDGTTHPGLSITKTITALAVLQLVDRGRLELDRPAVEALPDFPYGREITIRHLLSHTAGIPNPIPIGWIHLPEERMDFDPRRFFEERFAAQPKVRSAPNERFRYSNLGYVLLGRIVEEVSGMPYESYVTENILVPLGLSPRDLGFEIDPEVHTTGYQRRWSPIRLLLGWFLDTKRHLEPTRGRWQAFRPYQVNGSAYGGLIGSADGFTRYGQALLDPESGLLSDGMRQALFTEHRLRDGSPAGMGLSWFHGSLDGHPYLAHAGGGGGVYAELRIYPDLGRGSVIFFNRTGISDVRFLDRVDRGMLGTRGPAEAPVGALR